MNLLNELSLASGLPWWASWMNNFNSNVRLIKTNSNHTNFNKVNCRNLPFLLLVHSPPLMLWCNVLFGPIALRLWSMKIDKMFFFSIGCPSVTFMICDQYCRSQHYINNLTSPKRRHITSVWLTWLKQDCWRLASRLYHKIWIAAASLQNNWRQQDVAAVLKNACVTMVNYSPKWRSIMEELTIRHNVCSYA